MPTSLQLSLAVSLLLVVVPLASEATFQWLMQPFQPTAFGGSYFQMPPPARTFLSMAAYPSYNYHLPSRTSYSLSSGSRLAFTGSSGTSSRWQLAGHGAQPLVVYRPPRPLSIPASYPAAIPPSPSRSRVRPSAPATLTSGQQPAPSRQTLASVSAPAFTRYVPVNPPASEPAPSPLAAVPRQAAAHEALAVPIVGTKPTVAPVSAPAPAPTSTSAPESATRPRPVVEEGEQARPVAAAPQPSRTVVEEQAAPAAQPTPVPVSAPAPVSAPEPSRPVYLEQAAPVAPLVLSADGSNPDIGFDSPRASALEMNPLLPPTTDPSEGYERANSSGMWSFTENLEPDG